MPSLGLIMILCNEEKNLARSLGPVAGLFDEVVVVDTGSVDATVETARTMGATVHQTRWNDDFAEARNLSISKARADYLFWLDGDNEISAQGVETLYRAVETEPGPFIGWCREVLVPRGGSLIQKRLFPNRPDVFFSGRIHEQLGHPDGMRFAYLDIDIRHWGYQDPQAAKAKGLRNLKLLSTALETSPRDIYLLYQKGKTLFNLRRYREARVFLEHAATGECGSNQNPELEAHAWILLGLARERSGDKDAADLFKIAAEKTHLARKMALFHLGRIKAGEGDQALAAEMLERFLQEPDQTLTLDLDIARMTFQALMLLAGIHAGQGSLEKSREFLLQARDLEPDNPLPRRELVRVFLELGQMGAARAALDDLIRINPKDKSLARLKEMTG